MFVTKLSPLDRHRQHHIESKVATTKQEWHKKATWPVIPMQHSETVEYEPRILRQKTVCRDREPSSYHVAWKLLRSSVSVLIVWVEIKQKWKEKAIPGVLFPEREHLAHPLDPNISSTGRKLQRQSRIQTIDKTRKVYLIYHGFTSVEWWRSTQWDEQDGKRRFFQLHYTYHPRTILL